MTYTKLLLRIFLCYNPLPSRTPFRIDSYSF
jgi:hypothetical protein